MRKSLLILRHEFIITVRRFSFLLLAVGIPLISALIFMAGSALSGDEVAPSPVMAILNPPPAPKETISEGYIDQSGFLHAIPAGIPEDRHFMAYPDEIAAQAALAEGAISAYYLIPEEYLTTGEIVYVQPDFDLSSAFDRARLMQWILHVNLLDGDIHLTNQVANPLTLDITVLEPATERERDSLLTYMLPFGVMMIYYTIFMMTAGLLLNSMTREKENRVIEIMMSTITPRQLLGGKIIGLGLAGLLQAALWVGTGYILLRFSGNTFEIPTSFQLPPSILFWGLVFFLLGYAVYACLLAAVGALVPNLREASQLIFLILLPIIIPVVFSPLIIQHPNSWLAIGLSLFPLTAPVAMMTRLAAAQIPVWQPLLAAILLAVSAILILHTAAGMFRAQNMLSGQSFNFKRVFNALRGRA